MQRRSPDRFYGVKACKKKQSLKVAMQWMQMLIMKEVDPNLKANRVEKALNATGVARKTI